MEKYLPNLFLIAGTGRKSGKTSLACKIIERFHKKHDIIGIKICPYFHELEHDEKVLVKNSDYVIVEEAKATSGKDSSRLLEAGSSHVYYIQVKDEHLMDAFEDVLKYFDTGLPIVCESGGLRKFVKPGLFLLCNRKGKTVFKENTRYLEPLADKWINFDGSEFNFDFQSIFLVNNEWKLDLA